MKIIKNINNIYTIINNVVLKNFRNEKELLNLKFIENSCKNLKKLENIFSKINLSPKKIVNI